MQRFYEILRNSLLKRVLNRSEFAYFNKRFKMATIPKNKTRYWASFKCNPPF